MPSATEVVVAVLSRPDVRIAVDDEGDIFVVQQFRNGECWFPTQERTGNFSALAAIPTWMSAIAKLNAAQVRAALAANSAVKIDQTFPGGKWYVKR